MLVFIDDSGDPGFKINKGSSKTFVMCCVVFDDELEAEKTAIKIKELRRRLKKKDSFEFKFNKCSKKYRIEFLKSICDSRFRIRAIVMPKEKIHGIELRRSTESFYKFTIKTVLKNNFGKITNAKIRLDGHGNRLFRRELLTYLKNHLNNREQYVISNIKFRDSHRDVLIQLADMIAGSINRTFNKEKTDSKLYWYIIKKRKEDLWVFGK